ncbi:hypothetical protein V8C35DRAFT_92541 [Trichoderma chlorosporum]
MRPVSVTHTRTLSLTILFSSTLSPPLSPLTLATCNGTKFNRFNPSLVARDQEARLALVSSTPLFISRTQRDK